MTFNKLPSEIKTLVFSYLDCAELINCFYVSKSINKSITTSSFTVSIDDKSPLNVTNKLPNSTFDVITFERETAANNILYQHPEKVESLACEQSEIKFLDFTQFTILKKLTVLTSAPEVEDNYFYPDDEQDEEQVYDYSDDYSDDYYEEEEESEIQMIGKAKMLKTLVYLPHLNYGDDLKYLKTVESLSLDDFDEFGYLPFMPKLKKFTVVLTEKHFKKDTVARLITLATLPLEKLNISFKDISFSNAFLVNFHLHGNNFAVFPGDVPVLKKLSKKEFMIGALMLNSSNYNFI